MRFPHGPLTLSLIAALSAGSQAQQPAAAAASATAHVTSTPAGQTVSGIDPRIWCIYQARNGDHWFGSNGNGAYRFDGERLTHYTKTDGLSGLEVRDIEEDAQGNVLISTNSGVSRFDGKTFTDVEFVETHPAQEEWVLNPDDVWIVFNPGVNGPCRYDGEKLYQMQLSTSPAADARRDEYTGSGFSQSAIYSTYKDRRGHQWFGTAAAGLCRYDGQTLSWMYEKPLTTTPSGGEFGIRSIYEDRAGDFWICNTRQRFKISTDVTLENGHSVLGYEKTDGLPDAQSDADENFTFFPSMTEDDTGALWMACGSDGAWRYDGDQVTRYALGEGAYAITIYCDMQGTIWVGTLEHGVQSFDGERFVPFMPQQAGK